MVGVVEKEDYYAVLQIDAHATQDEVRSAYKRLALLHHPDRSGDPQATRRMQAINAAYAALGDPEKRAQYDRDRLADTVPIKTVVEEEKTGVGEVGEQKATVRPFDPKREAQRRAWLWAQLGLIFRFIMLVLILFSVSLLTGQVNAGLLFLLVLMAVSVIASAIRKFRGPAI